MARNPFRFGPGKPGTFDAARLYPGSERGAATLDALALVKCSCGHHNMVDTRVTGLRQLCIACGRDVS